ncbi:hypothetical protein SM033_00221 [Vibrio phage vB_VpaM_sm033]|nr:hypothetical protein SM033_00221 [Vibrio phage vB_VpaM_sm033]
MMSIIQNNLMFTNTEKMYFDRQYVDLIEDHKTYLKGLKSNTVLLVEPGDTFRFRTDLFAYLRYKGIPSKLWVPVIVINDLRDGTSFTEDLGNKSLIIPDISSVDLMLEKHKRK